MKSELKKGLVIAALVSVLPLMASAQSVGYGGGGNGPIAGSFGVLVSAPASAGGEVLGASTSTVPTTPTSGPSCSALLTKYMGIGRHNDPAQVTLLQEFLNSQGYSVPVTGFFGPMTEAAVEKFQLAHLTSVLNPWGISAATGYVYKTTLHTINSIACPTLNAPEPTLP